MTMAQQTIQVTNASFTGTITYDDGSSGGGGNGGGGSSQKLEDCIKQNTKGQSEGRPSGVPHDWDWYSGKTDPVPNPPPEGWHAVTGWGQVYCEEGQPVNAGEFWIRNQQCWLRQKDGNWIKAQDQVQNQVYGSSYPGNFQGSSSKWNCTKQSDNSMKGPTPANTRNVHWYHNDRASFDEGSVDAVLSFAELKVSNSNVHIICNMGADWWENTSAQMDINPGAGMANWVRLGTEYKTCYFMSISEDEMRKNPAPPLK